MDPASIAVGIRVTTTIAATLLRGIAALFGSKPIHPYRYYRLGSLVQRWATGTQAGISAAERDVHWSLGVSPKSPAAITSDPLALARFKQLLKVSVLAPDLFLGRPPSRVRLENIQRSFAERRSGQYWDWLEMGRAEFRDRWIPKARAIVEMDPALYFRRLREAQATWTSTVYARNETPNRATIAAEIKARIHFAVVDGLHRKKLPALARAWRGTSASHALKSANAAKAELNRWISARSFTQEETISSALWFGPPVPWALELAAQAYGQYGPAAVIQYATISPGVTRDLKILLKRISPAAISDPVLATFLRGAR